MIELYLKDDQYPYKKESHTRVIARGVVISNSKKVAILRISRNDIFGNYDYYELPGGGVKIDEENSDAIIREIKEEVGVEAHIIEKIGVVYDFYNLLERKNENHYYLLKVDKFDKQDLEEYETQMIKEVLWVDIKTAIECFEKMVDEKISLLVKRRELPILYEVMNKI